jgi:prepilin-type N-terminal cleavage/methylation domain-containing protein
VPLPECLCQEEKAVNKYKKKAFTLVELLVVISIIALLLAILMPALQKARQQARTVVCAANFHQVGLVYQVYSNEYHAWIPRFVDTTNGNGQANDPGFTQSVLATIPFLIDPDVFDLLVKNYHTRAKFWVCPSLVSNGGKLGFMRTSNFNSDQLPRHGDPPYPYFIGIARLNGLTNMSLTTPATVTESSLTPLDSGNKVLAADLNIRWDYSWANIDSVVSHLGKSMNGVQLPLGGNKLQADGSTKWVAPNVMAANNALLTDTARPKYDHWKGQGRDYFW